MISVRTSESNAEGCEKAMWYLWLEVLVIIEYSVLVVRSRYKEL